MSIITAVKSLFKPVTKVEEVLNPIELKIKTKSLADESKTIRLEERKLKEQFNWHRNRKEEIPGSLIYQYELVHNHRVWDVRNEARATLLARAYIAGKPYSKVEQKRKDVGLFYYHIVPRIRQMVKKYNGKDLSYADVMRWAGD